MMRRLQSRVKASPGAMRDSAAPPVNNRKRTGELWYPAIEIPLLRESASSLDLGIGARVAGWPVVYELAWTRPRYLYRK